MDLVGTTVASAGAVVTGWVGGLLGVRRERSNARRNREQLAGQRYLIALRELRRLFRVSDHTEQPSTTWADAFLALSDVHDDSQHLLPRGWGHLRRSVRAAVGTYAGGVSFADMDTRAKDHPVAEHDERWRQYGLDYLEMLIQQLQRWTDEPWTGRGLQLDDFDTWLAATGRHPVLLPAR